MKRQPQRWGAWRRAASVALVYAFLLAGFVESLVAPSFYHARAGTASEICLLDLASEQAPGGHRHGAECCLQHCRAACAGPAPFPVAREIGWDARRPLAATRATAFDATPPRPMASASLGPRGPPRI